MIRGGQEPGGAYVASPAFPVYRYCWLRDGSFTADAMSRAGDVASAESFFSWCSRVLLARRERVESLIARSAAGGETDASEFLPARYTLDGRETGEPWTDFQLDGYGTWLWALDAHCRRHARPIGPFLPGALLSARYIGTFWGRPCFDWWEEHAEERHTSTLAALFGGLAAASAWDGIDTDARESFGHAAAAIREIVLADARRIGRFAKRLGGDEVDASLVAAATPFGLVDPQDQLMTETVRAVEQQLVRAGGVHRYAADTYYGGGVWLLLAGLLGWHYAATGRGPDALAELDWIVAHASPDGDLPEQASEHLLAPDLLPEWRRRWGPTASPLLWSHAMFLTLALELGAVTRAQLR